MTRPAPQTRLARQSAAAVAAAREEAIGLMNPALKKKFQQIEKRMSDARAGTLRYYHELGKTCMEIQDNPATYERGAFRLLERALGTQARSLRKAANFARSYNDDDLDELIELKSTTTDFMLHWGHISYLLIIGDKRKRFMWAKRAVKNLWPPEELHRKITKHYGPRVDEPHGRVYKLPATIPGQVRQIRNDTEKWLSKQKNAWNGEKLNAFANIAEAPADTWTPELIEDLKVAKAAMQGLVEEARANIGRIDRLIKHAEDCLERTLQQRAEDEALATSAGKEARRIDLSGSKLRRVAASA